MMPGAQKLASGVTVRLALLEAEAVRLLLTCAVDEALRERLDDAKSERERDGAALLLAVAVRDALGEALRVVAVETDSLAVGARERLPEGAAVAAAVRVREAAALDVDVALADLLRDVLAVALRLPVALLEADGERDVDSEVLLVGEAELDAWHACVTTRMRLLFASAMNRLPWSPRAMLRGE